MIEHLISLPAFLFGFASGIGATLGILSAVACAVGWAARIEEEEERRDTHWG